MRYKISEGSFNASAATSLCIQIPERVMKDDCLYGIVSNEKHMKPRTDSYCNHNPDTVRKRSLTAHFTPPCIGGGFRSSFPPHVPTHTPHSTTINAKQTNQN